MGIKCLHGYDGMEAQVTVGPWKKFELLPN
jgi:hypothetical protein